MVHPPTSMHIGDLCIYLFDSHLNFVLKVIKYNFYRAERVEHPCPLNSTHCRPIFCIYFFEEKILL